MRRRPGGHDERDGPEVTTRYQGLQQCLCVAEHRPPTLELEWHHVWPLGEGGPDVAANKLLLCPTTHGNVHVLFRRFKTLGRVATYSEISAWSPFVVSRYAYGVAKTGYERMKRGSL